MKKVDVKVGTVYVAKLTSRLTHVRITVARAEGWTATNLATGRDVHVRSAKVLWHEVTPGNRRQVLVAPRPPRMEMDARSNYDATKYEELCCFVCGERKGKDRIGKLFCPKCAATRNEGDPNRYGTTT